MHGAQLIEALQRRTSSQPSAEVRSARQPRPAVPTPSTQLEFFGIGGDRMRSAGCETVVDSKDLAVVGISEILGHLPRIWRLFHKLIAEADQRRPDLAIVIDSP